MTSNPNTEKQSLNSRITLESETRLLFQLMKCSHFIERETNNILHHFGMKQQQFVVLNEIIWNGPISQKDLCDNLLFEKSNTSRIVKLLSEKGLIQIKTDLLDRRLTLLAETSEGFDRWSECMRALNGESTEYIPTLSREQIDQTFKQLKQLEKSFQVKRKNSS